MKIEIQLLHRKMTRSYEVISSSGIGLTYRKVKHSII